MEECALRSFYPASASSLGTAPLVIPITENDILVDGVSTYLTRYDFSTGNITESFEEKKSVAPSNAASSGGKIFSMADKTYIAHSYNYEKSTNPSNAQLVSINEQMDFSSMKSMWVFPQAGLGGVNIGTKHVLTDYDPIAENKGVLYVYSPGNGLSAYELTDNTYSSGIVDVVEDCGEVEYYNLQGVKISKPSSGMYIKRHGVTISKQIIK
jgi:hypothetical protein